MATIAKSPKAPSSGASSQPFNYGDLKKALEHLGLFFSSPQAQNAKDLLKLLHSQQEQISEWQQRFKDQFEEHNIAVRKISLAVQHEVKKTSVAEAKAESFSHALEEERKTKLDLLKHLKDFEAQVELLQSAKSKTDGKLAQANRDITSLQEKLKEKDSMIDHSKAAETELSKSLLSEKQKHENLQKVHSGTQDQLRDIQSRLDHLESFRVSHQQMDEQTMLDGFEHLWEDATADMLTIFSQNLESRALKDPNAWKKIEEERHRLAPHLPLPASNSDAAKGMRLVIILAILSREINKYIFQPAYLIPEDSQMRRTLSDLAETNPEKEWLYRSLTLSLDPDMQQASLRDNIQTVVQKMANCTFGLLSDPLHSEFREIVTKIVKKAAEVWQPLQHAQQKYEPYFDPHDMWWPFEFPGMGKDQNKMDASCYKEYALMVFPRISLVSSSTRDHQSYVINLSKAHPLFVSASQEITASAPPSPTTDRIPPTKTRRASISCNSPRSNGKPFSDKKVNGIH